MIEQNNSPMVGNFSVNLGSELRQKLLNLSETKERSVSFLLRKILTAYFEKRDGKAKSDQEQARPSLEGNQVMEASV